MQKPTKPMSMPLFDFKKKKIEENNGSLGYNEDVFKAQTKATNFGLELFKFISPAEIGVYSLDTDTGTPFQDGYQGAIANNQSWWTDAVHYDLKSSYSYKNKTYTGNDLLSKADSKFSNPLAVYSEDQNFHNPVRGDAQNNFFGRTHRTSSLFAAGGLPYSGAYSGRFSNLNPFSGIAGGYADAKFNTKNTWNHYEVAEQNKDKWDFGMSDGFQSVAAFSSNASTEWNKMNEQLNNISNQVIKMKDAHTGYTSETGSFHSGGVDPFATKWQKNNDSITNYRAKSLCTNPFDSSSKTTQAPNYFEIIQSGAWSAWTIDNKNNQDIQPAKFSLTKDNIDKDKFYYFLKSMLESKRRGLETYRHLLGRVDHHVKGKVDNFSTAESDPTKKIGGLSVAGSDLDKVQAIKGLRNGEIITPSWSNNRIINVPTQAEITAYDKQYGTTWTKDDGTGVLDVSRGQCSEIKAWFDNVTSKTPPMNSYYDFLFFQITHGFFNQMESICGGGQIAADASYSDAGENSTFFKAAVVGGYKYIKDNNLISAKLDGTTGIISKLNTWKNQHFNITTPNTASVGTYTTAIEKNTVKVDDVDVVKWQKKVQTVKIDKEGKSTTSDPAWVDITDENDLKLLDAYQGVVTINKTIDESSQLATINSLTRISTRLQTAFKNIPDLSADVKQNMFDLTEDLAPVCEFFRRGDADTSTDTDLANFKMPIANFAHYDKAKIATSLADIDFDTTPHSLLATGNNNIKAYDAYAQLRGSGCSWNYAGNRRDGIQSMGRINPAYDIAGLGGSPDQVTWTGLAIAGDEKNAYSTASPAPSGSTYADSMEQKVFYKRYRDTVYGSNSGDYSSKAATNSERGKLKEIDENPAFAGFAYMFTGKEERENMDANVIILNAYTTSNSRYQQKKYKTDLDKYKETEYENKRRDAIAEAQAVSERKSYEARMESLAAQRRQADKK